MTIEALPATGSRLGYLDGLRGLAVLSVVAWHYTDETYARFLPYGARYAGLPVLDQGWAGVNLFFLISGFVIFMTLDKCRAASEFYARRWLRLFPAMLVATVAILAVSQVNGVHMPHGEPPLVNALPGLTFISPGFWQWIAPIDELDGVYWTLYVEAGFYLVAGATYFRLGWRGSLITLAALWLLTYAAARLGADPVPWTVQALQFLGAEYFGWFVSGALFYKAAQHNDPALFAGAVLVGLAASQTSDLWQPADLASRAALVAIVLLFAIAQRSNLAQRLLNSRALLAAGIASYPLYLLHNELGVGLIGRVGSLGTPGIVSAILVGAGLFAISTAVAARVEPWSRKRLAGLFRTRRPAPA